MSGAVITFLTDFGLTDSYVGAMKGVVLGINPDVQLVDLTHQVPPQEVLHGAFLLGQAWSLFPAWTIHLAVVDPGVGTERQALLVNGKGHWFLVPDNGLITFALPPEQTDRAIFQPYSADVPDGFHAYVLTNQRYWRQPVSATFHGRDIFAPVAAHFSLGVTPEELGEPVDTLTRLAVPVPQWQGDTLLAHVLYVDWFGNVVTTVPAEALASVTDMELDLNGMRVRGLVSTYAQGDGLVALVGSHGYVELALTNGSAADDLGARVGDELLMRRG
jgi:S-adenosylmethionine hydrolase